jgi:hypothetical protein
VLVVLFEGKPDAAVVKVVVFGALCQFYLYNLEIVSTNKNTRMMLVV